MIDHSQFKDLITRMLKRACLYSESAVELLLGTAAVESEFGTYIRQIKGPALGVFQMEPATERDIWKNWLLRKPEYLKITMRVGVARPGPDLEWNFAYQILMARFHYLRVPEPLPPASDVPGLAKYWKKHYNTVKGKGSALAFMRTYKQFCIDGRK